MKKLEESLMPVLLQAIKDDKLTTMESYAILGCISSMRREVINNTQVGNLFTKEYGEVSAKIVSV